MDFNKYKIQGIKINYYYICKRKLWFYDKGITMEQNSDRVLTGKLVHENSYPRIKKKEISIDNMITLDMFDDEHVKEIKLSSKTKKADEMQLYYYLYYLKQFDINRKGKIHYVKEKKIEEIVLTTEIEKEIEQAIKEIEAIISQRKPPKLYKLAYCKKCAYFELCFAKEEV